MVHAYHVIFGAYGFWLPNDPRGSWSDFIAKWELTRFGRATKTWKPLELTREEQFNRETARQSLLYPPVTLTGEQALSVAKGFLKAKEKTGITIFAASILPEHVHLVVARHRYKVEQIVGICKGEATKRLKKDSRHPLAQHIDEGGNIPTPWGVGCWKVFLDNEEAIEAAIRYVELNPVKEGKSAQTWGCVSPFTGLDRGVVFYP